MGTKSQKKAKTRLDAYYRLAKDQGYRARSAFKLIQLNKKYDFLAKSRVLVDLCAAPGGWCQVAAKYMPMGSKIVGVDLVPIAPIRGVKTFVGDITDDKTRKMISIAVEKQPVDCVVHDGAPNVGGAWARDLFAQNALVLSALKLATQVLKPGGWFVSKVFRSQDFQKLMWVLKQFFPKVEATKPLASRMESAEIFVVCAGYNAPQHIDPKMFSAQHVFSEVGPEKILSGAGVLITQKNNVPQGYNEFATISHRQAPLSHFLSAADPKDFLNSIHEITFPEHDRHFLSSKHSKKELIYVCQDLQQAGPGDKKRLLRWREQLLREQQRHPDNIAEAAEMNVSDNEGEEDGDSQTGEKVPEDDLTVMAKELLALRAKRAKEMKKKQQKVVDRKLKQVRGLINYDPYESAQHPTDQQVGEEFGGEGDEDEVDSQSGELRLVSQVPEEEVTRLFDQYALREDDEALKQLNLPINPVVDVHVDDDLDEIDYNGAPGEFDVPQQLIEGQEEAFDVDNWGNYVPATRPEQLEQFNIGGDDDEDEDEDPVAQKRREKEERQDGELDEAAQQAKWKRRHRNIDQVLNETFPKVREPKKRKRALEEDLVVLPGPKQTRRDDDEDDDDDFTDTDESVSSLSADEADNGNNAAAPQRFSNKPKSKPGVLIPDIGKQSTMELVKSQRKEVLKDNKTKREATKKGKNKKDDSTFEEIPLAMTDPEIRARTLAIATKMLDKNHRRNMLENAINKYTHNDDDDLPDWFIKDEKRNCKVNLPVTAAEIEAQRARFIEVNSRPSKKVMEAMGRKRRRAQRMLRQTLEKAKTDPRARAKAAGLSVRTLMRSKALKGDNKKKKGPIDSRARGEMKRDKQRVQKQARGKSKRR